MDSLTLADIWAVPVMYRVSGLIVFLVPSN
jgi:hypothetical protein